MNPTQKMKAKLESLGIPFVSLTVTRSTVIVTVEGRESAEHWHGVLSHFVQSKIKDTVLINKVNKRLANLPSCRPGFLVGGFFRKDIIEKRGTNESEDFRDSGNRHKEAVKNQDANSSVKRGR